MLNNEQKNSNDPYIILGVNQDLSTEEIKDKYKTLFAHYSIAAQNSVSDAKIFEKINRAYKDIMEQKSNEGVLNDQRSTVKVSGQDVVKFANEQEHSNGDYWKNMLGNYDEDLKTFQNNHNLNTKVLDESSHFEKINFESKSSKIDRNWQTNSFWLEKLYILMRAICFASVVTVLIYFVLTLKKIYNIENYMWITFSMLTILGMLFSRKKNHKYVIIKFVICLVIALFTLQPLWLCIDTNKVQKMSAVKCINNEIKKIDRIKDYEKIPIEEKILNYINQVDIKTNLLKIIKPRIDKCVMQDKQWTKLNVVNNNNDITKLKDYNYIKEYISAADYSFINDDLKANLINYDSVSEQDFNEYLKQQKDDHKFTNADKIFVYNEFIWLQKEISKITINEENINDAEYKQIKSKQQKDFKDLLQTYIQRSKAKFPNSEDFVLILQTIGWHHINEILSKFNEALTSGDFVIQNFYKIKDELLLADPNSVIDPDETEDDLEINTSEYR